MRRRFISLAALVLCVGAFGARAAPVPAHLMPKEEPLFHSVRPGDTFVLRRDEEETTITIKSAERVGDIYTVVKIVARSDGSKSEQVLLVSPIGVRTIRFDDHVLDEPHVWLRVPHVANNTWITKRGGTFHYKTVGWEDLTLPYGKVRALRVERTNGEPNDTVAVTYWAHGLGWVKYSHGNTGWELKSFTPGK